MNLIKFAQRGSEETSQNTEKHHKVKEGDDDFLNFLDCFLPLWLVLFRYLLNFGLCTMTKAREKRCESEVQFLCQLLW